MTLDTPAFRLLCACCRWPSNEAKSEALAAALSEEVDWDLFSRLAETHRVHGLVHSTLRDQPIPPSVRVWLDSKIRDYATSNLLQTHETVRLCRLLGEHGIPAIAVKGVALGFHIYGNITIKQSRDIDLLVPAKSMHAALELAETAGYSLFEPASRLSRGQISAFVRYGKEFALRNKQGIILELHAHLVDNQALLGEHLLDQEGQWIAIDPGHKIKTLNDEDLFSYLCAHGAHHHWSRLKWLADVNALLARAGNECTIARFNQRAIELGALWPAVQAQMLCKKFFDRPLPAAIASLAATKRAKQLTTYCQYAMTLPAHGTAPEPMREFRDMLAEAKLSTGWRFWLGHLRAHSVKTSVILELNLPEKLIFLYPYIRPFFWVWFRWLSRRGRYSRTAKAS